MTVDNGYSLADPPSRADLRRRKLIETARKLFIERGFHATGVAQIARASGIAVGQMYRDFASKEDIVAALVSEDSTALLRADRLCSAIKNGDSEQAMNWLLELLEPDRNRESNRLFAEIIAESARNQRVAAIFMAVKEQLRANLLAALTQLAPDPRCEQERALLADLIQSFSLGLVHHELLVPDLEVEPLVRMMEAIIKERVRALAAPEG